MYVYDIFGAKIITDAVTLWQLIRQMSTPVSRTVLTTAAASLAFSV